MNRRDFAKSIAATAALPLLPTAAVPAAPAIKSIDLMWAKAIAKAQNNGSASLIAQSLKVPPHVAEAIQDKLLSQNVIRAGALPGQTVAVNPTFTGAHMKVAAKAVAQTAKNQSLELVKKVTSPDCGHDIPDDPKDDCSEHHPEHPPQP